MGQSDILRLLTASATSLSRAALLGHGTFDFTSSKAPRAAQLPTGEPEKCWSLRAATVVSPPPLRRPCSCSSSCRDKSQTGQFCAGSAEGGNQMLCAAVCTVVPSSPGSSDVPRCLSSETNIMLPSQLRHSVTSTLVLRSSLLPGKAVDMVGGKGQGHARGWVSFHPPGLEWWTRPRCRPSPSPWPVPPLSTDLFSLIAHLHACSLPARHTLIHPG